MHKRFGTLFLCIAAVVALSAMSAMPAFAGNDNGNAYGHDKDKKNEQNYQEADQEASEQSSDQASDSSAQPEASPSPAPEDPEGKRADGEGEPRGETADSCTNTHEGNFSGNGANHHGPYDSTCDGSASKNGNGGGGANGRPCAGCVGNADNKNPKGQYPDGNHDGNAGYECDGNNGVGRSNPAHTGCQGTTTTPPPPPPGSTCPDGSPMPSNGKCGDDVKPSGCPTNPNLPMNHKDCNPPVVCPAGTDMAGLPPGVHGCNLPKSEVCPAGTDMAGLPPGVHGCNLPVTVLCPAGTDMAGLPPGVYGCNIPSPALCPAGTDMAGLPPSAFGCNLPKTEVCPAGTDMAGVPVSQVESCNNDDVQGEVVTKVCPSGVFAGMPMMNESDCNDDRVLGKVIRNNSNPAHAVTGQAAKVAGKVVGAVGAVLPFTGAGDLYFMVAIALLLVAAGTVSLKLRKQS
ncbi:MAG: hypothetical protein QOG04_2309 [Actinomycetota bacterium]|jgi:hypothetical protein|nr:hypothetical protein [Actinomycetota bacterium]